MTDTDTETEEVVEEPSRESQYLVVDPDDYQKTKKLELIHSSKSDVLKVRRKRMSLIREYHNEFRGKEGLDMYTQRLAQAVSQYGSELLPLIEEAKSNGTLTNDDLEVTLTPVEGSFELIYFIQMDGRVRIDDEPQVPPEATVMSVYRQLDRIQRKLGLGLDIVEDKGPAEI